MVGLYLGHGELLMKLDKEDDTYFAFMLFDCCFRPGVICIPQLSFVSPGRLQAKDLLSNDSVEYIRSRVHICHKRHKQRLCKIIITRVKVYFVDVF